MRDDLKALWALEKEFREKGKPDSLQDLLKRLDPVFRLALRVQKQLSKKASNEFGEWRPDELYAPALFIQKDGSELPLCGECHAGIPAKAEVCPFCDAAVGEATEIFEARPEAHREPVEAPIQVLRPSTSKQIGEPFKAKKKKRRSERRINGIRVSDATYRRRAQERRKELYWPHFPYERKYLLDQSAATVKAIYLCLGFKEGSSFVKYTKDELIQRIIQYQPDTPMVEGWKAKGFEDELKEKKKNGK